MAIPFIDMRAPQRVAPQGQLGAALRPQPDPQQATAGWGEFLSRPEVKAFLLQFGAQMLQPSKGGFLGALGESAAAGGAAVGRVRQQQLDAASQRQQAEQQTFENQLAMERLGIDKERLELERKRVARAAAGAGPNEGKMLQQMFNNAMDTYDAQLKSWEACVNAAGIGASADDIDQRCGLPPEVPTYEGIASQVAMRKRLASGTISDDELHGVMESRGGNETLDALSRAGVPQETLERARKIAGAYTVRDVHPELVPPRALVPTDASPRAPGSINQQSQDIQLGQELEAYLLDSGARLDEPDANKRERQIQTAAVRVAMKYGLPPTRVLEAYNTYVRNRQ